MLTSHYKGIRDQHIHESDKPKRGSWVTIVSHDEEEVRSYARKLKVDEDALVDGIDLHESPRIEHDGSTTYIYVRYCEPTGNLTSTEPLLIVATPENVITLSRKPVVVLGNMLKSNDTVTTQKVKLILQILNDINKSYRVHINSVTKKIFATRNRLERKIIDNNDVLDFIDTEEDLNEFLAALMPYGIVLKALVSGKYFKLHEEDKDLIEDLELSTNELIDLTKSRLKTMQNIREAYTTIATNNLNRIFKRLTSITIFLMVPSLVASIYGMNIDNMPLSQGDNAFWVIATLTSVIVAGLIVLFSRRNWL